MTILDRVAPDAATTDRLKLLQADIHDASVMGNRALAARLTMRYLDEATGSEDERSSESAHRET